MKELPPGIRIERLVDPEEVRYTGAAQRLVAMADVLGFRDLTRDLDASRLGDRYRGLLEDVKSSSAMAIFKAQFDVSAHLFCDPLVEIQQLQHCIYSDTVVLWSRPFQADTRSTVRFFNIRMFLDCVRLILVMGLNRDLPLRIGIAFGECIMAPEEQMYLGKAVAAAYETEQRQEWVGIAYHPTLQSTLERLSPEDLDLLTKSGLLVKYEIPVKDPRNPQRLEWSGDWPFIAEIDIPGVKSAMGVDQICEEFIKRSSKASVQAKWVHTLEYVQECRRRRMSGYNIYRVSDQK